MDKIIDISELIPDDENANKGSEFGNSLIEKSLRQFGAGRSILLDKNNRIVAGNKTIENAASIGLNDVIIVETDGTKLVAVKRNDIDLNTKEGREMALADNASAKASITWDDEVIEQLNEKFEIDTKGWGVECDVEFNIELGQQKAEDDDFDIPDEIKTDIVIGDLFEIGEHRLLCGDSTDVELIKKLLNGNKIDLLLTDPPYGINYGGMLKGKGDGNGGSNKYGWKSYDAPEWDKNRPEKKHIDYLRQISKNQIIWGGNYFTDYLPPTMGWLIWDKGQRGFSLADGEMAWTSFINGLRIKVYSRALANREEKNHPTQKPIEIINWCFEYADRHATTGNMLVFDAFLGSGSTMVAAHQLKRKCYGMELDPKYCQVIIDRMHKLDPSLIIKKNGEIMNFK